MWTIFNPDRFQEVDIVRANKEEIEIRLAELKKEFPEENLIIIEVA